MQNNTQQNSAAGANQSEKTPVKDENSDHHKLALEKLAFLPAALEIEAAPPAKWTRSLLWVIIALLVISTVWASWAEIDIIATAQGKIVPSGQVKVIQPLETGVVKTIFVKEGQHVKAGDKLLALDGSSNQADVYRLTNEWQGYKEDLAIKNEFLAKLTWFEKNLISITKTNKKANSNFELTLDKKLQPLFESVWQEYHSKLSGFESEIIKLHAEKKSRKIDVERLEKTLPLVIEREQSYLSLLETSAVSRNQYLELKQQRIDQEESLNLQRANVEQTNASIVSAKQNLAAYIAEFRRTTLQEINQLTRQSNSIHQELNKANRLTQLRVLTSPVDGIVEQFIVNTIGGVVTPAQELLHIVPKNQQLEIEANLHNKDIGFVHTGQVAEIKIDSFPFTKYGIIDSEIIDISADAVEDEQFGLLFPLKATMHSQRINVDGKWVNLKPGMSVTVEIKTGTRRLMEFLLAPLMKGMSEGARER